MPSQGSGAARALRRVAVLASALAVSVAFAGRAAAGIAPNATITASIVDGVAQVTGTGGPDGIELTPFQSLSTLAIVDPNTGTLLFTFDTSDFDAIHVSALGGSDRVLATNGVSAMGPLTIDGGAGSDTLFGADGNDVIIGGGGDDFVDGNIGNDTVFMGTGNDTFNWDPGDGSDVLAGDAGADTLRFNGSNAAEKIALSANGTRLRLVRDVAAITTDAAGIENAVVNTHGSPDTVTVDDLSDTGVRRLTIDLAGQLGAGGGDVAADDVILNGTDGDDHVVVKGVIDSAAATVTGLVPSVVVTGAEFANDRLDVNPLAGVDRVTSHLEPGVIQLFVNGVRT